MGLMMFGGGLGLGAGLGQNLPTPPYASNLVAWYRSDRRVSVLSGHATGWGDISGHGKDMQVSITGHNPGYTAVDAAYNNLPSIQFTAASTQSFDYNAAYGLAQPFTIIWIGHVTSTNFLSLVDGRGAALRTNSGGNKAEMTAGTVITSSIAITSPSFVAGVFDHAGGTSAFYVNSSTAVASSDPGSGTIGAGVNATYFVGGPNVLTNYLSGTGVEAFIYGEAISQPNIATIVAYAAARYAQSWS